MNFLNHDFPADSDDSGTSIEEFRNFYLSYRPTRSEKSSVIDDEKQVIGGNSDEHQDGKTGMLGTLFWNTMVLAERTTINYSRNLLAYGVRAGMYAGRIIPTPCLMC